MYPFGAWGSRRGLSGAQKLLAALKSEDSFTIFPIIGIPLTIWIQTSRAPAVTVIIGITGVTLTSEAISITATGDGVTAKSSLTDAIVIVTAAALTVWIEDAAWVAAPILDTEQPGFLIWTLKSIDKGQGGCCNSIAPEEPLIKGTLGQL